MKHLSGGDAVVVVVLLLFICGWPLGVFWHLDPSVTDDLDRWGTVALAALILWPPLWAGRLITRIVEGDDRG